IDLPYAYVDYDFADLLKKNIHIQNMEIDLKEFFVVKDKNGNLNVNALKPVKSGETKESAGTVAGAQKKEAAPKVKIDQLLLKIGKVHYLDYSKDPNSPARSEFTLNFQGRYSNISDLGDVVKLIVGKAVFDSALNNLVNLNVEGLKTAAEGAASTAAEGVIQQTGQSLLNVLQGAIGGNVTSEEKK
ncbi:MAG: hypothetical protein PHU91_04405, partial [Candidatus Omnitrophica bacterium]|nr:hypothetical protein [Candidatus Omnitrophota bacterium]